MEINQQHSLQQPATHDAHFSDGLLLACFCIALLTSAHCAMYETMESCKDRNLLLWRKFNWRHCNNLAWKFPLRQNKAAHFIKRMLLFNDRSALIDLIKDIPIMTIASLHFEILSQTASSYIIICCCFFHNSVIWTIFLQFLAVSAVTQKVPYWLIFSLDLASSFFSWINLVK